MKLSLLSILTLLFYFTSSAQEAPLRRIGCHHRHLPNYELKSLTAEEQQSLNASIARSDTFDILSYIIHIDVTDYAGTHIHAATTLSLTPKMENQEFVRLDLKELQVDSVTSNSGLLTYAYDGEILKVDFPTIPSLLDTVQFTVHYQGVPYRDPSWGGFYFENNYIYNLGIGISTIPPNFGKVWYPCFDSFVERATYEYHVKSVNGLKAHCQGDFLGELQLGADTVIRSFAFNQPIPTHLSAIAVSNYQDINSTHSGSFGEIPIRLTGKSNQINAMNNVFQNLGEAIDACEYWYGPYIWGRIGYVLTTDGALEIPTNIAYPQYMTSQSIATNNGLLSHELGHHWWGNAVTPYNHNDMWLKEGPAEYSAHLMKEWMSGEVGFRDMVKKNHLDVLKNAHVDDDGFHPLSPMPDAHIYGTHTYYKGASVMHNLRGYMGDEAFRLGMTTVQEEKHFQTITPEEFRDELEEATGVNLHPFFDDQVFKPGFSVFVTDSFEVAPTSPSGYTTLIHLQQKLRACPTFYTNVPLDITLVGSENQRITHLITASGQFSEVVLTSDFIPEMVVLNGNNRLNQARMDYEFKTYHLIPIYGNAPYVDMDFKNYNTVDSTLVRIEHIWAAPDEGTLGPGIYEISNVHYWIVDGLWKEEDHFGATLPYNGNSNKKLDFDLYNVNEQNAILVYRKNSTEPWQVYDDIFLDSGGLTDGKGNFIVSNLRKGEYAFANGDASVAINELKNDIKKSISLFPIPANDKLSIQGNYNGSTTAFFEIISSIGENVLHLTHNIENNFTTTFDISSLAAGNYILSVVSAKGEFIGTENFNVIK